MRNCWAYLQSQKMFDGFIAIKHNKSKRYFTHTTASVYSDVNNLSILYKISNN